MNLLKILKIIETLWPFIKEIVLDKDTPKSDRRKKNIALTLLVSVVFFGTGAWSTVRPYVTPYIPPNQTSTSSQSDRDTKWERFLEDRLTENVSKIAELQQQLANTTVQLRREQQRAEELQKRIDALGKKPDSPEAPSNRGDNRILNRLENLRNGS